MCACFHTVPCATLRIVFLISADFLVLLRRSTDARKRLRQLTSIARARTKGVNVKPKHDQFPVRPLLRAFAGKTLGEITPGAKQEFSDRAGNET